MSISGKTVAVIGGGPAGMMAAIALKEKCGEKAAVVLLERNHGLGRKILLSGGGRCNVTTGIRDVRKVLENYPRGARFLMSAMFRFPPEKVMAWFEDRGVALKTEADGRVFPVSDDGAQVVGALEEALKKEKVKIMQGCAVLKVVKEGDFSLELGGGVRVNADFMVIATGGSAYRQTGSHGDGFSFAESLGHRIPALAPSLQALVAAETWLADVAGVSFTNAELKLNSADGERSYERTGAFVFTHKGVSGPAVFALSSMAAYEECSPGKPMSLAINFFPELDAASMKKRLQKVIEENGRKSVENVLDIFLPKSLGRVMARELGLPQNMVAGDLGREQRESIAGMMRGFVLKITGREAGEEFVTAGGVKLDEVDSATMESKLCPGLYLAGEVLDVDGFTGGFNLQAAWATGRLAGESIAARIC